jgi:hypothetical protein
MNLVADQSLLRLKKQTGSPPTTSLKQSVRSLRLRNDTDKGGVEITILDKEKRNG